MKKSPFTGGETRLVYEPATFRFRKQDFVVAAPQYECVETGRRFTTGEQDDQFLAEVHRLYRERNFIPTAEQLQATREQYGLSAARMSALLGMGTNQYARYEAGELPTESNGTLLSLAARPEVFRTLVEAKHQLLKPKQHEKLRQRLAELLDGGGSASLKGVAVSQEQHASVSATAVHESAGLPADLAQVDWLKTLSGAYRSNRPAISKNMVVSEEGDCTYVLNA